MEIFEDKFLGQFRIREEFAGRFTISSQALNSLCSWRVGWVEDISFTIQYLQGWIYYSRERPGGRCRVPDCVGRVWCLQTLGQPYTLEVVLFAEGFEWSDELCLSRQLQTGNETL